MNGICSECGNDSYCGCSTDFECRCNYGYTGMSGFCEGTYYDSQITHCTYIRYVYDNQIRHCITDLSYINGWVEAVTYIHEIRAQKSCLVALYFLRSFYSFTVRLYICTCIQQSNHTLYIYVYMYMTIKSHTVHVCTYVYDNQITHCTYIRIHTRLLLIPTQTLMSVKTTIRVPTGKVLYVTTLLGATTASVRKATSCAITRMNAHVS